MAYLTFPTASQRILYVSEELDRIQWIIDDCSRFGSVHKEVLDGMIRQKQSVHDVFCKIIESKDVPINSTLQDHIRDKFFRINDKMASLLLFESTISPQKFIEKAHTELPQKHIEKKEEAPTILSKPHKKRVKEERVTVRPRQFDQEFMDRLLVKLESL